MRDARCDDPLGAQVPCALLPGHLPVEQYLGCPLCGGDGPKSDEHGCWQEDSEHICVECGATLLIGVGDDEAHVQSWTCKHGKDEAEACVPCAELYP